MQGLKSCTSCAVAALLPACSLLHPCSLRSLLPALAALTRPPLEPLCVWGQLSSLCQETAGDFSAVTAAQLDDAERRFAGAEARLAELQTHRTHARGDAAVLARAGLPTAAQAAAALAATVDGLRRAGALAILRVKGPSVEAAVARGVELAAMGCNAIEVTLDSRDWKAILAGLNSSLPPHVLLGVGASCAPQLNAPLRHEYSSANYTRHLYAPPIRATYTRHLYAPPARSDTWHRLCAVVSPVLLSLSRYRYGRDCERGGHGRGARRDLRSLSDRPDRIR